MPASLLELPDTTQALDIERVMAATAAQRAATA
jgi:hypothetical protein